MLSDTVLSDTAWPVTHRPYRGKRVADLLILGVVAIPAAVLSLVCAVLIRLTSRGPVLFLQERVGMGGEPFVVRKFRTMLDGDNPVIPDRRSDHLGRLRLRRTRWTSCRSWSTSPAGR
ncbi:MAG: sugar transferase [Acidimicrobiales bacterium]